MSKEFYIFKQNTDAIATNRGFYYQYLKTVKLWLDNYINGVNNEIYCEREDDIFEYNVDSKACIFRQIKCYSDNVGLNSSEIKGSLLHFYDIYQNKNYKKSEFYLESNQTFKPKVGKTLKAWYERQKENNFSLIDAELIETRDILKKYVQDDLDKFLKKDISKEEKNKAKVKVENFNKELESSNFQTFLESIRWDFSEELDTHKAIANLSKDILKIISEKLKYDNRVDKIFLLGYLVNLVLEKSIEADEDKRLLTNVLLKTSLKLTEEDSSLLDKDIKILLDENFFIKEKLGSIETTVRENHKMLESLTNNTKSSNNNQNREIYQFLEERYKTVQELKKAIFSYYPTYGSNIDDFRRADTFDEIFEIFKREEVCLYCILKELKMEYAFFEKYKKTDCEDLKQKSESSKEIDRLIIEIDIENNDLKTSMTGGYIGYSLRTFDRIEAKVLNLNDENFSEVLFDFIDFILKGRILSRTVEVQLLLPNSLFKLDFQCNHEYIIIVKRLLFRIENYTQLDIPEIKFWKNNSDFYKKIYEEKIDEERVLNLDNNKLSKFRKHRLIDKHICVLSDHCLSESIQEIYKYGVPMVLYSYHNICTIINVINFKEQKIKYIKEIVFSFMDDNKSAHFIYDDYNDLEFLEKEDDYL